MKHEPVVRVAVWQLAYLLFLCIGIACVGVQIMRHGDFMTQLPTIRELAMGLGIGLALFTLAITIVKSAAQP